jgi:predicted membrane channel-forming protein YqfA (hemolysin III family)
LRVEGTHTERNIRTISLVWRGEGTKPREEMVNGLIYLVGLIVIIMFILSFFGLR